MNINRMSRKLEGLSDNLLSFYLVIVKKYALLEPMIFSQAICETYGNGSASTGFGIIRDTLYIGLILDIANLVHDNGRSTNPSVFNIRNDLKKDTIIRRLRERYTFEYCPEEELGDFYERKASNLGEEFDSYLKEFHEQAENLMKHTDIIASKKLRDKFIAHLDLEYVGNNYQYPDIRKYGLTSGSIGKMIDLLKPIVEKIGFIVRRSDFDWDLFQNQNTKIANGYWRSN